MCTAPAVLAHGQLELQTSVTKQHPLSPVSPVRGSLFITTVLKILVTIVCKSHALNTYMGFLLFHFKCLNTEEQ